MSPLHLLLFIRSVNAKRLDFRQESTNDEEFGRIWPHSILLTNPGLSFYSADFLKLI